jgi:D-alanyl-D-alanine carboxypeptidase (penicillin-binding protein 5/6)
VRRRVSWLLLTTWVTVALGLLGMVSPLGSPSVMAEQAIRLVSDESPEAVPAGSSWPDPGELVQPVLGEAGKAALEVKSPSVLLMDPLSGQVLFLKDADRKLAPASLTKIMTLLLAIEAIEEGKLSRTETLTASANAESYGGTEIWLEPGEQMPIDEVLLAIAVASANDASVALAEHMAGSEEAFLALMNERARELGLTSTHFANSHGLDSANHWSTARDMALLCSEAAKHPDLLHYTAIYEIHIRPGGETWLVNRNQMVNFYQGCDGLKTGWTNEAGYSVAVTAKRGETRFVVVAMGAASSGDRFADATRLLDWAFANYTSLVVAEEGHTYGAVPVNLGVTHEVEAVAPSEQGVLIDKGSEGQVNREVSLVSWLNAPVKRGDAVGTIVVKRNGTEIGRTTLVADRDVRRLSLFGIWWRLFRRVLGEA